MAHLMAEVRAIAKRLTTSPTRALGLLRQGLIRALNQSNARGMATDTSNRCQVAPIANATEGDASPNISWAALPEILWVATLCERVLSPAAYSAWLERNLLEPVQEIVNLKGCVPGWMQRAAVLALARHMTIDARPRAPTVVVCGEDAARWHAVASRLLAFVQPAQIRACAEDGVAAEVLEGLLAFHHPHKTEAAWVEAFDAEACLLRVTYHFHGEPPTEHWQVGALTVAPAFAKHRACNYFGRRLLRQRIVWLPLRGSASDELLLDLDGRPVPMLIGPARLPVPQQSIGTGLAVAKVRGVLHRGRGWGPPPCPTPDWRARAVMALASFWPIRKRFGAAWLFVDREFAADDSAEHMYRWVRQRHPEINAWFLVRRGSPDWVRLEAEGFRLVEPGPLCRLLLLNAQHVVSSHTDYVEGGLDQRRYGGRMKWRFTFVPHGISKDDVSHWFNTEQFDLVATTSPAERDSMAADDTGYRLTNREAVFTGLPRHDALRRRMAQTPSDDVKLFLVMPTWRASLFDERSRAGSDEERLQLVRNSAFAAQWRTVLGHNDLQVALRRAGLKLGFMAHANLVRVIDAFELPPDVALFQSGRDSFQSVLCRAAALLTDYTSVAFEVAYMRRPVFYFQPDRERFYRGDHNWRPGFFDYDRDGFGPVAFDVDDLVHKVEAFVEAGCSVEPVYLKRMERLMPHTVRPSCELVFEAIQTLDRGSCADQR